MKIELRNIELIDDQMEALLRTKTPAERLAISFDCNRTMRLLAGHRRTRHPAGRTLALIYSFWKSELPMTELKR